MPDRRDPLDKSRFLESNRERWAIIFLVLGAGVFTGTILVPVLDPTPFMQFLLAIGSLFILGASGDSWMKAYSVKSIRETQIKQGDEKQKLESIIKSKPNKEVILEVKEEFKDDPSYAPIGWLEEQIEGEKLDE
jgi:hypothetical protein